MNTTLRRAKKLPSLVKIIDQTDIHETLASARAHERKRLPILLNDSFAEIPQRFVNCLTASTYVRPHNHLQTGNWELMSWIEGLVYVLFFDDQGNILDIIKMAHDAAKVVEIPPNVFHTFVTPDHGVYLEIRDCAYNPEIDRVYATWSPLEMTQEADLYLKSLVLAINKENSTILEVK